MSINRRYNIDRRNVNNRTFTNNRSHINEPSSNNKETSPTRVNHRSKYYGKDSHQRSGMDKKTKDSPRSNPRYQVLPEADEDFMEEEFPVPENDAGNSGDARMLDSDRDHVDDGLGDRKYESGNDVEREESDGRKGGDFDDTDDGSYHYERLFMSEE
ncbi:hypothetical protein ACOMHN_033242 [Nucella lapillus]